MFWRSHKPLIMTRAKPQSFFFLEFSAIPLTSINTNSYPKLCVVYTLLNRFATNLLNVRRKKNTWCRVLFESGSCGIVTFVWYCYLFNEYRIIFQQQQLQNYLQIISYKCKEHYIWNNFSFLSLTFSFNFLSFLFFLSFFSYSAICVNIFQKYTHLFTKILDLSAWDM